MSAEFERQANSITLTEYQRNYQKIRKRNEKHLTMKPAQYAKMKGYYDEYLLTCQQNLLPVVEFNQFVMQFAEIGWLNSRSKLKGK